MECKSLHVSVSKLQLVKHVCMSTCACLQVARLAEEEAEQAAAIAAVAAASPPKQVCFDADPQT